MQYKVAYYLQELTKQLKIKANCKKWDLSLRLKIIGLSYLKPII